MTELMMLPYLATQVPTQLPWVEHRMPQDWYAKVTTFRQGQRATQHKQRS